MDQRTVHKSFDIVAAFKDVLGHPVAEIPENYERGDLLVDTAMDLAARRVRRRKVNGCD